MAFFSGFSPRKNVSGRNQSPTSLFARSVQPSSLPPLLSTSSSSGEEDNAKRKTSQHVYLSLHVSLELSFQLLTA